MYRHASLAATELANVLMNTPTRANDSTDDDSTVAVEVTNPCATPKQDSNPAAAGAVEVNCDYIQICIVFLLAFLRCAVSCMLFSLIGLQSNTHVVGRCADTRLPFYSGHGELSKHSAAHATVSSSRDGVRATGAPNVVGTAPRTRRDGIVFNADHVWPITHV